MTIMEDEWASLQLVEFNKDPIFKEALEFLKENKYKDIYFSSEEKYWDKHHKVWLGVRNITKNYIEKKSKQLFQYDTTKVFYYEILATNVVVYYLLREFKIECDLKKFILKIIKEGYFVTPISSRGLGHDVSESTSNYYLALKWFYNEKTKKYYSEELLERIKNYEEIIKHSMDSGWEERYDFRRSLKY